MDLRQSLVFLGFIVCADFFKGYCQIHTALKSDQLSVIYHFFSYNFNFYEVAETSVSGVSKEIILEAPSAISWLGQKSRACLGVSQKR